MVWIIKIATGACLATMDEFGSCPTQLHFCPYCLRDAKGRRVKGKLIANPSADLFDGDWCKTVKCPVCVGKWYICPHCISSRKHI